MSRQQRPPSIFSLIIVRFLFLAQSYGLPLSILTDPEVHPLSNPLLEDRSTSDSGSNEEGDLESASGEEQDLESENEEEQDLESENEEEQDLESENEEEQD